MYSSDKKEMEFADSASISNLTPFCNIASNSDLSNERIHVKFRKKKLREQNNSKFLIRK
jgi:hypothetical protein